MKKTLLIAVAVSFILAGYAGVAQGAACDSQQWRHDRCESIPGGTGQPKCMYHEWPRGRCKRQAPLVLHGIKFDTGSARIKRKSYPILEANLSALRRTGRPIVIEGHTDNVGGEAYNLKLSDRRALSVKKWLVKRGIKASRIMPVGMGEARPMATNATSRGRAQNRRIEIHFR